MYKRWAIAEQGDIAFLNEILIERELRECRKTYLDVNYCLHAIGNFVLGSLVDLTKPDSTAAPDLERPCKLSTVYAAVI
jgi:hypothetical protein